MKLSNRQITFIDTYLENSGVEFLDIRFEMVDHVASVLENKEGDFYENFKIYMIENKKALLESNKKFKWNAEKKVYFKFLKLMINPFLLIFFIATFFIIKQLFYNLSPSDVVHYFKYVFIITIVIIMAYSEWRMYKFKIKLSTLRKTTLILIIIYYFNLFVITPKVGNEENIKEGDFILLSFLFSFIIYSCIVYIVQFHKAINYYRNKLLLI